MTGAVTPCLWFDGQAEEAARFYTGVVPDSRIDRLVRSGMDWPAGRAGDVVMVAFTLGGRPFQALNGGPGHPFTQAVSLSIECADQAEIDRIWDALTADGGSPIQCGWLTDRYGLSWQVVPAELGRWMAEEPPETVARIMSAFLPMRKLDLETIRRARDGG